MNCKRVIQELSDYLDGDLNPSVAKSLEAHLNDCDDCRIVVDTTRKTIEVYCNSEPLPLPSDVRQRLTRVLGEKARKPTS